ncbi:MAG: hypothetical protein V1890_08070 [Candidatus Zixiibacteriota bacterium]
MSRNKKRHKGPWHKGPSFVMLEKDTLNRPEWRKLSPSAMITYIYIKKNYNGGNNGEIPFKYVELKGILAPATISRSLKELQGNEWIEKTRYGGMFRYYCLYKLTGKNDRIR